AAAASALPVHVHLLRQSAHRHGAGLPRPRSARKDEDAMTAETNRLAVEPTVSWRREMVVGRPYLVKVDLRLASGSPEWPYDEEELAFTCMLDGALDFAVEAMEDASVVLHRFGGSYGPAEFVVTPVGTGAGTRSLWLTIVSSYG